MIVRGNKRQRPSIPTSSSMVFCPKCWGALDLRTYSRADLVVLRDQLATTRKPSKVNQILAKLSAVFSRGEFNGHLEKRYDKKLKLTKGTESERKAFSQEQVSQLVSFTSSLPEASWTRWLLSLGGITGGRLNEICQNQREYPFDSFDRLCLRVLSSNVP